MPPIVQDQIHHTFYGQDLLRGWSKPCNKHQGKDLVNLLETDDGGREDDYSPLCFSNFLSAVSHKESVVPGIICEIVCPFSCRFQVKW